VNGVHDMGGMMNYGPVVVDTDEPLFHADWERDVFGMFVAMSALGLWNSAVARGACESMPPAAYVSATYYEIWLAALEYLVVSENLITAEQLAGATSARAERAAPPRRSVRASAAIPGTGFGKVRDVDSSARFTVGDPVVTRNINPHSHTRLPRYARDKPAVVERVHGAYVFPDAQALRRDEDPHWLYTIRFNGRDLWGEDADPTLSTSIDAWETYLDVQ
jgi:nitrile hydratase beta subunit